MAPGSATDVRDRPLLRGRHATSRSATASSCVSHVVVAGRTTIGARTRIFPFASIGHQPQDLKYKGEPSTLDGRQRLPDPRGRHDEPRHRGRRHADRGRRPLRVPRQQPRRPRLPRRQQRHLLQQRHAGRPCHGRRLRHHRRRRGRASSSRASARIPSSAACRAWRTISSPTAWRSATARICRGSTSSACSGAASRARTSTACAAPTALLFADEGTLLERLDDVEEEFDGHPIVKEIVAFIRAGGKRSLCVPHPDA